MNNPGEFVAPKNNNVKQPPSCWLIGGIGCLIIVILAVLAIGLGTFQMLRSKSGKELMSSLGGVMKNAEKIQQCKVQMSDIHDALIRYQLKNGHYPTKLTKLYPDYLPNANDLHCSLDTNPDPKHVSFTYTQPPDDAPSTSTILSLKWDNYITLSGHTIDDVEELSENIAGSYLVTQYQNGKVISTQVYNN